MIPAFYGGFLLVPILLFPAAKRSYAKPAQPMQPAAISSKPALPCADCSAIRTGGSASTRWRPDFGPLLSGEDAPIGAPQETVALQPLALENFLHQAQQQQNPPQPPAKKQKQTSSSTVNGSPGHIYWVIPAYKVDYGGQFKPLTPKEKFHEWAQGVYDPLGFGVTAFEAGTLEYSSTDGFCGYGHGWAGYGKCYASLEADSTISSFIGDYLLTVWWHQDPRFFRLGKGSFGRRLLYAVSRVFVTNSDSGKTVFYSSALTGTAIASGISNLYAPQKDRGFSHSVSRGALDLGNTAIYNAAAEFWPDIHRWVRRTF